MHPAPVDASAQERKLPAFTKLHCLSFQSSSQCSSEHRMIHIVKQKQHRLADSRMQFSAVLDEVAGGWFTIISTDAELGQ
jgi:hypothetical protein